MKIHPLTMMFVIALALAACQSTTANPPTATPAPTNSPAPTATNAPSYVRYISSEPYAYYDFDDSFENVTDLDAYGITSTRNTVKVNTTSYAMGHQSLEADGTVGESLDIDFSMQKILGTSSYDFSNKTIVLSVSIPADSPIDTIWFEADSGDQWAMIGSAKIPQYPYGSLPFIYILPKGKWVEAVIDIPHASDWNDAFGPNGALTNEQALDILKHCDAFKIRGMNGASGGSVATSFLLDDLRWLDRDNIPIDPNADTLRKYAANSHLYIGSYAEYNDLFSVTDAKFSQVLVQEYNLLIPGQTTHWSVFEPSEGAIDFSKIDDEVDFAINNHMAVYSYMDVVHTQLPEWLKDKSFGELGPVITNFIDAVGQHYSGKIAIWNVFSEVVNDVGDGFRNRSSANQFNDGRYSPWVEGSDTSLIKAAFRQARISDPHAILILNDYNTEEIGWKKSEFFYNFVVELVAEGVPIDGVAFELHDMYPPLYPNTPYETGRIMDLSTYLRAVDANIKRYNALGLKVVFSETDVPVYIKDIDTNTATGQAELIQKLDFQAQVYGGLMKVALANPNVIDFSSWGFTDRRSDVNSYNDDGKGEGGYSIPNIFDLNYKPKPAYDAVLNALMNP